MATSQDAILAYQAAVRAMQAGGDSSTLKGAASIKRMLAANEIPSHLLLDAHSNLGTAMSMLGRQREAMSAYEAALGISPRSGFVHYNLAVALAESGHAAEAETSYRAAVQFSPRKQAASAGNNLGNLLVSMGRKAEARHAFTAAIQSDPTQAMAHNNLANLVRDIGDNASYRAAGRGYAAAIRLSPRYREAYKNLGNLLKEREAWRPSAVRAYRIALRLLPTAVGGTAVSRQSPAQGRGGHEVSEEGKLLLNLGEVLQWLSHHRAANLTFALGAARGVWQHPQQRPTHLQFGLTAAPWWRIDEIPLVKKLLAPSAFALLRADGLRLLRNRASGVEPSPSTAAFLPYFSPALSQGSWTDVTFTLSGTRQPGALHAPKSYALYESLGEDALTMVMGSAYFSVLSPGTRLRPHCVRKSTTELSLTPQRALATERACLPVTIDHLCSQLLLTLA